MTEIDKQGEAHKEVESGGTEESKGGWSSGELSAHSNWREMPLDDEYLIKWELLELQNENNEKHEILIQRSALHLAKQGNLKLLETADTDEFYFGGLILIFNSQDSWQYWNRIIDGICELDS